MGRPRKTESQNGLKTPRTQLPDVSVAGPGDMQIIPPIIIQEQSIPGGVSIGAVVNDVLASKEFKDMMAMVDRMNRLYTDMHSRVQEIENFRNPSSVEGKMRDMQEKYQECLDVVAQLRNEIKKVKP